MGCFPPRPSLDEAVFGMYINNLYSAIKGLSPFMEGNHEEKRKKRLDDFNCSIRKILKNEKALMGEGECISLDEKERRLQQLCDEITDILLSRKKDLRKRKINGDNEYLLFLDQIFDFFLSEKNLPSFIDRKSVV